MEFLALIIIWIGELLNDYVVLYLLLSPSVELKYAVSSLNCFTLSWRIRLAVCLAILASFNWDSSLTSSMSGNRLIFLFTGDLFSFSLDYLVLLVQTPSNLVDILLLCVNYDGLISYARLYDLLPLKVSLRVAMPRVSCNVIRPKRYY